MFFKMRILAILVGLYLASGCDFLRSPQKDINDGKRITLNVSQLSCLGTVSAIANKYFEDKASQEEIEFAFNCIDLSIDKFINVTKPSLENKYSADDLRHFLNRYLLDQQKISTEFMHEIMKVKAFILGGDVDYLSQNEIYRGRSYLVKVKQQLKNLLGSTRIITFQNTFNSEDEANRILKLFKDAVQELTADTVFNGDYSIHDSIKFFNELALYAQNKKMSQGLQYYSSLIEQIKNLFIGVGNNTQSKSQWLKAVEWTAEVYAFAIEVYWLYKNFDSESGLIWSKGIAIVDRFISLLTHSPQFIHHRMWHTVYIDSVIHELMRSGLVRSKLAADIWIKSYKMAIIRFLNRDMRFDKNPAELVYIDESHLNILSSEWQVWKMNQTWVLNQKTFLRSSIQESAQKQMGLIGNLNGQHEWFAKIAQGSFYSVNSYRNITFNGFRSDNSKVSISGLSLMNTINSISRFIIRSYADNSDHHFWNRKLTRSGLVHLENDFFELLMGLRIINIRVLDRPSRLIQEANFFTLSGNGDDRIELAELSELITLMWVSGKFITDQFHSELLRRSSLNQCSIKGYDIIGKPMFDMTCVEESFYLFFPKILAQIEGLRGEWVTLSANGKFDLVKKLLALGKNQDSKAADLIEYVEYRAAIVFVYYLESIFARYDQDGNGTLNYEEILSAYPRFKGFIQERIYNRFHGRLPDSVSNWIRDWNTLALEVFLYIVYIGKEPSLTELVSFQYQKITGLSPIDRIHMLNVFNYLKNNRTQD